MYTPSIYTLMASSDHDDAMLGSVSTQQAFASERLRLYQEINGVGCAEEKTLTPHTCSRRWPPTNAR